MKHHIFVSYSSKDAKIAFQLVDYLESQGIPCWIAPRNIASGHDYTDSIDEAIKSCDGFVLIFSSHSAKSVWVKKELALGVSHQKNIFPFKISDIEIDGGLNFMLNNLQWIIATEHPSEKFPDLVEGLRRFDPTIGSPTPTALVSTASAPNKKFFLYGGIAVAAIIVFLLALHPWSRNNPDAPVTDSAPALMDTTPATTPETSIATPVETQPNADEQNKQAEKAKAEKAAKLAKAKAEKAKAEKEKLEKAAADKAAAEKAAADKAAAEKAAAEKAAAEKAAADKAAAEKAAADKAAAEKAAADKAAAEKAAAEKAKAEQSKATSKATAAHKKYTKAVSLFNARRYKEALDLFEQLKSEGSTESGLDTYIKSCKENTK